MFCNVPLAHDIRFIWHTQESTPMNRKLFYNDHLSLQNSEENSERILNQ